MNLKKRNAGGLKYPFCLAALILLCVNSHAQETLQKALLTPDEAVEMAIRNNLSLQTSRANLDTKKRVSSMSWNQFIPSVSAGASLLRDNQKSTTTVSGIAPVKWTDEIGAMGIPQSMFEMETPAGTLYNYVTQYSMSVEAPQWHIAGNIQASLSINIAMFENMKRLRLDYEGGLLTYEKAKIQLERDVRKAYHNMLLIQENIALLRGNFENAQRQVQMAQANYNAGLAPELTLLQARVARENLRPAIDQAENGLKLSMAQFAMFLGLNYDTAFELIPVTGSVDFIPFEISEMISKAAAGKPDILELKQTMLLLESARRAQVYSLTPSLNLSWNYTSAFVKDPWKDSWFGNKDDWRKSGSLTIALGVRLHSLIPFSTDFQGIRNLDDQIRTAAIGLAQMVNATEIEIYNIILSLERTRTSTEALAQTVSLAEQSYRLTEQAYRAGLQDYFQVQNAQQSLNQARVQMLEQQFNYLNSLIDLEYSIGVPFGTLSKRSR
jgi:outer membrane protein TolC